MSNSLDGAWACFLFNYNECDITIICLNSLVLPDFWVSLLKLQTILILNYFSTVDVSSIADFNKNSSSSLITSLLLKSFDL